MKVQISRYEFSSYISLYLSAYKPEYIYQHLGFEMFHNGLEAPCAKDIFIANLPTTFVNDS